MVKAAVGNFHDTAVNSQPAFAGELRAAKPLAPLGARCPQRPWCSAPPWGVGFCPPVFGSRAQNSSPAQFLAHLCLQEVLTAVQFFIL